MSKDNSDFFKIKNDWSLIKDKLLGCYLNPYFQKILATGKPICYIDCFSGKGQFEDGNPGSPIIALTIRDQCLERTRMGIDKSKALDTTFIDLNYADELKRNLAPYNNEYGTPHIISGKYEETILGILKNKSGYNVFLYIDPYGIRALDTSLYDQFKTLGFNTFEMLINFNSFGFFRDACRVMSVDYKNDDALKNLDDLVEYSSTIVNTSEQSSELLTSIAGGSYWKEIVQAYKDNIINGYQAEQRLSTEYKQRLKQRYKYVLDMPIRLKAGQRPKYRMIHACDHEEGCFLMAKNMQNRKDELYTNIQQAGQISLFEFIPDLTQSAEGEWVSRDEVVFKVKECLKNVTYEIGITKFIAKFVNDYGLVCEFKMIHEILYELKNEGVVEIIRNPDTTEKSSKMATYWEEKNGKTVTIRRMKA